MHEGPLPITVDRPNHQFYQAPLLCPRLLRLPPDPDEGGGSRKNSLRPRSATHRSAISRRSAPLRAISALPIETLELLPFGVLHSVKGRAASPIVPDGSNSCGKN